jgi:hypothetical protein
LVWHANLATLLAIKPMLHAMILPSNFAALPRSEYQMADQAKDAIQTLKLMAPSRPTGVVKR